MQQLALLYHYPKADHLDEFLAAMVTVRDAMAAVPGCLEVGMWREPSTRAVVAVTRWSSPEAFAAGRQRLAAGDLPIAFTDWEYRDRVPARLEEISSTPAPVGGPAPLCVVLYESADDLLETAPVHFPAHKARVDEFRGRGDLLLVGTFGDPLNEGSMAIFGSRAAAEEFVRDDPFVINGVVKSWQIRDWNESFPYIPAK
jgi:uncharacterized protein YciI/quinol monooxygenase YgiN